MVPDLLESDTTQPCSVLRVVGLDLRVSARSRVAAAIVQKDQLLCFLDGSGPGARNQAPNSTLGRTPRYVCVHAHCRKSRMVHGITPEAKTIRLASGGGTAISWETAFRG